jgi:hypothetical protein
MQMLMDLGANVYSEDFEQHFLAKAAEFYQVCTPSLAGLPEGICTASQRLSHIITPPSSIKPY